MPGYTKLSSSILDSSIWAESDTVRIVWITMLAMCDKHGFVDASVGGIARRAVKPRSETDAALKVLMSPDPDSKNPAHEGCRIQLQPTGGYVVLNYKAYRNSTSDDPEDVANRERVQRYRQKHYGNGGNITSHYTGDGDGDGSLNTTGGAEKPTTFHAPPDPIRTFNDASNTPATMTAKVKAEAQKNVLGTHTCSARGAGRGVGGGCLRLDARV